MKVKGNILKILNGATSLRNQTTASVTLDQDFMEVAGSKARATEHVGNLQGWQISGTAYVTKEELSSILNSMADKKTAKTITFGGTYGENALTITGNVIFTSLSFSSNERGLVSMSFSAIGNGKPTITLT